MARRGLTRICVPCRIPQLLTCLVRNEGRLILNLLSKVGSMYPQAVYFPIRTLYLTLKIEQRERCKLINVPFTYHYVMQNVCRGHLKLNKEEISHVLVLCFYQGCDVCVFIGFPLFKHKFPGILFIFIFTYKMPLIVQMWYPGVNTHDPLYITSTAVPRRVFQQLCFIPVYEGHKT